MRASREDYRLTAIVVVSVLLIVSLVTSAIDFNSVEVNGLPAVVWCAIIAFAVQWLAWIPASISQTERFYDLTGGLTYLAVVAFSLWAGLQSEDPSTREWLISALVAIWAIRLSSFLFLRIHEAGKDGRFDQLKASPVRFLVPWTLQALWVFLTLNVVVVINSQSGPAPPLGIWDGIGLMVWIMGFGIEVVADSQKTAFNANPENEGKWIDEGLWSRSRHPNYLGEILLWAGIACFGIACFDGLEMVAWVSPIFVYLLLTKVSGIPLLDRRALAKWGDDPDYQRYRDSTPALIPRLTR
uniref:Putative steroid reductase n=1 Tax=uncultured marine group II/III euryarchaeote KM3_87_C01 TaxID=1456531 RepID=A0A075HVF1_9EURY|nr:putative steroid reductase [uncultured marine group II/III euryarchaeote KM3_87_C01]